ncbi:MAG: alanine--tRNA ligase [bacterium]|nr:alanine--tRNA ligase [bacterium]
MNHLEIRNIFFNYFTKKLHHKVLSAPLVPAKDPTLLFTNAGMNQFKSVFLQEEKRNYDKAVSIQKCMRVSGKHNDFDEVGKTEYHHTLFEMMGNFSFGDYFKERAIEYGWDLLTNFYKFAPEDLWVTVYKDDDEAFKIWEHEIGIPSNRIVRLGEKDNFWQMGDTGPCGPCSEIHFDRGSQYGPDEFTDDNKRFVEIWNLVFMQYFKDNQGKLNPLPAPSIDTGMGLERLTMLLQGKNSNYHTDLFMPIIEFTAELAGVAPDAPEHQIALKVVADHIRALSFLISDGVLPANDGRGYVLRRVLRRAAKHGKSMGFGAPFLAKVSAKAIEVMKDVYPELEYNRDFIAEVISAEEERFNRTVANGLKRFEELLQKTEEAGLNELPGEELFVLSGTYGFPLDFAVDLANEKEIGVDHDGYNKALETERENSRPKKQKQTADLENIGNYDTVFGGYTESEEEAVISAIYVEGKEVSGLATGQEGLVVFNRSPFYAESGGQVGDTGHGNNDTAFFEINNTQKTPTGAFLHKVIVKKGALAAGDEFNIAVDKSKRKNIEAHHSTTHLLHAALREVLGPHVKQAGSYVGADRLRFDFTHFNALSGEELEKVEAMVNAEIRRNTPVGAAEMKYEVAIEAGAMAIFNEKYSDVVRMVSMGDFSKELCGGTHLNSTGEAGFFKITSESSTAAGIRRIEAVAGEVGCQYIANAMGNFGKIQTHFGQKEDKVFDFLVGLEKSIKEKEKALKKQKQAETSVDLNSVVEAGFKVGDLHAVVAHIEGLDRKGLSTFADDIVNKTKGLAVVSTNMDGKSAIIVSLEKGLTPKLNAGKIVKEISGLVNGRGGGRPDFAQAGGDAITDEVNFKEKAADIVSGYLQ